MVPIWELKSLREASTRPEFYRFFTIGLKDLLFGAYKAAPTTYQQLVTFDTSTKDKEGYPSIGNLPLPDRVLEGQPFPERGLPNDDMVELTNAKFGEIIAVTQELIDDDQTKRIKQMPMDTGNAHAKHEDRTVYSIVTGNPTIYDSQAFFSLNHPGFTGGGAIAQNDNIYTSVTMSANAIAVALGIIAGWTGHTSDDILDVTAKKIVCPKNLSHTARLLVESDALPLAYAAGALGPAGSIGVGKNVLKDNGLSVVSSARLDRVSATDWYVWTDFTGLLFQWRDKLQVFEENENSGVRFERDVYRWKTRSRWKAGVINWRQGMLVS